MAVAVPSPSPYCPSPACNVTIHNRCKDTLPNCTKVKQKVSAHLAATSDTSWPVSAAPGGLVLGAGEWVVDRHDTGTVTPAVTPPLPPAATESRAAEEQLGAAVGLPAQ